MKMTVYLIAKNKFLDEVAHNADLFMKDEHVCVSVKIIDEEVNAKGLKVESEEEIDRLFHLFAKQMMAKSREDGNDIYLITLKDITIGDKKIANTGFCGSYLDPDIKKFSSGSNFMFREDLLKALSDGQIEAVMDAFSPKVV